MAQVIEYSCGCMQHTMAGFIRRCPGQPSKSLTGRDVKRDGGSQHESAMGSRPVAVYEVANLVR